MDLSKFTKVSDLKSLADVLKKQPVEINVIIRLNAGQSLPEFCKLRGNFSNLLYTATIKTENLIDLQNSPAVQSFNCAKSLGVN